MNWSTESTGYYNIGYYETNDYTTHLEPQTTIYKWLFQLDNSKPLYRKWLFHQTSIYKWMFGVPRQLCRDFSKPWNQDRSRKKNNQFCAGMFSQRPNYTLDRFLGPQFWQLFKKEGIFWEPFILKREMGSGWSKSPSMDGQNNCQKWVLFHQLIQSKEPRKQWINQMGWRDNQKNGSNKKHRRKLTPQKCHQENTPQKKISAL